MVASARPGSGRDFEWTDRQREVLDMLAAGRTNPEIADALGISLDGAKWHVREIMGKLGVESREEAAAFWRDDRRPLHRRRPSLARRGWAFGLVLAGAAATVGVVAIVVAVVARDGDSSRPDPGMPAPSSTAGPEISLTPASIEAFLSPSIDDIVAVSIGQGHPAPSDPAGPLFPSEPTNRVLIEQILRWLADAEPLGPEPTHVLVPAMSLSIQLADGSALSVTPAWDCTTSGNETSCVPVPDLVTIGRYPAVVPAARFRSHELQTWIGVEGDAAVRAVAAPLCRDRDLGLAQGPKLRSLPGLTALALVLTNGSSRACTVNGAGIWFRNGNGDGLGIITTVLNPRIVRSDGPWRPTLLQPGGKAYLAFEKADCEGPERGVAATILVELQGVYDGNQLELDVPGGTHIAACGEDDPGANAVGTPLAPALDEILQP